MFEKTKGHQKTKFDKMQETHGVVSFQTLEKHIRYGEQEVEDIYVIKQARGQDGRISAKFWMKTQNKNKAKLGQRISLTTENPEWARWAYLAHLGKQSEHRNRFILPLTKPAI